jgi:hypothetical protein
MRRRRWLGRGELCRLTLEINGAGLVGVDLVDHVLEFAVGWVLAERAHDLAELFGCNFTFIEPKVTGQSIGVTGHYFK